MQSILVKVRDEHDGDQPRLPRQIRLLRVQKHRQPKLYYLVAHIFHDNQIGLRYNSWENNVMAKDVEVGVAGSLTMIVLFTAVAFLLRSFYKRFTRLQARGENEDRD